MALADNITEAVILFHEGSQFLHDVATGPASGDASTVTNPVDFTEQITVARAIAEIPASSSEGGVLAMDVSAGLIPLTLSSTISPFSDNDADAVIAATSTVDRRAISHYQRICQLMKGLDIWDSLANAYLMGSNYQSSSTVLESITGNNTASGTGTANPYSTTFNGTTDKYLVSNTNIGTALTGNSLVSVFKADGTQAVNALISSYQGGSNKGPQLSVGGASFDGSPGPSTIPHVYTMGALTDGSTADTIRVTDVSDGRWTFAAGCYRDKVLTLFGNSKNVARTDFLTEIWSNNASFGIGANSNTTHFFSGEMVFAAIFTEGLTDYQAFALRLGIESILNDTLVSTPTIVFDGNSLTASSSGGGTNWPTQLLAMAGWIDHMRTGNIAIDGGRQSEGIEARYFTEARQWISLTGEDNLYFLWSGINDITASLPTAQIIASLERHAIRAVSEGFRVVLLTLTPVADAGTGLTYGYSLAQQQAIEDINFWIKTTGVTIVSQVVDLDQIGIANPLFLDPTDFTYYTAGDGLHQNDAGRALVATKINDEVSIPILT